MIHFNPQQTVNSKSLPLLPDTVLSFLSFLAASNHHPLADITLYFMTYFDRLCLPYCLK